MFRYCYACLLAFFMLLPMWVEAAVDTSVGRSNVSEYAGSFHTQIPVVIAPGRAGLQPAVSLRYNSATGNGLLGVGWGIDFARIERSIKNGVPSYTDKDTFILNMYGAANTMVKQASGEYRVRNESAFLRIQKRGNYWLVPPLSG